LEYSIAEALNKITKPNKRKSLLLKETWIARYFDANFFASSQSYFIGPLF
jgi:hypothetical protein